VLVSMQHVKWAAVRAIVANSGNANACTGTEGLKAARAMCRAAAQALGIKEREVLVCSTGRIGVQLPVAKMEAAIAALPARMGRREAWPWQRRS